MEALDPLSQALQRQLGLAQREFERRKVMEGGEDVNGQAIPRMPTKSERQIHELTHTLAI